MIGSQAQADLVDDPYWRWTQRQYSQDTLWQTLEEQNVAKVNNSGNHTRKIREDIEAVQERVDACGFLWSPKGAAQTDYMII